jgi:AraC-like DNA-binding protein
VVPSPTNRLAYLGLRLGRLAARADALTLETLAGELLAEAVGGSNADGWRFRAAQLRWYAERIEAAQETLETQFTEPHTLRGLARRVGMSPFHFGRVFRELAGAPPHRYLMDVRLRHAAGELRAGARVTDACYAAGFGNLSHFVRLFHRRFRMPPSLYRHSS